MDELAKDLAENRKHRWDVLQKVYAQVSAYDLHYSTVRTATSAVLVSGGLAAAGFALKDSTNTTTNNTTWVLAIEVIIAVAAIVLNLRFQRLTHACRMVQLDIEKALASGGWNDDATFSELIQFRERLKSAHEQADFQPDANAWLLIIGVVAIFLVTAWIFGIPVAAPGVGGRSN